MAETTSEKNYYFFVGTVAELIKLFPVMQEMEKQSIGYKIIASGQNDIKNSDIFKCIKKHKLDIEIGNEKINKSVFGLFCWFVRTFIKSLRIFKKNIHRSANDYLIVHGDTVSTMMGAILGRIYKFKIFHIEAGLRSFNFLEPFPEEIDRVITSRLADFHFCPNDWAQNNLKKRKGEKINTFNNTLFDSLKFALSREVGSELMNTLKGVKYCLFVCHRQENVSNEELLSLLVNEILETAKRFKCVFILHEITKIALERYGLLSKLENNKNILLVDRVPYFELMHILKGAEFMVTDGGSNQEECYYLGIPTLILRKRTERNEGLGKNVILSKNDFSVVSDFIKNYEKYKTAPINIDSSPSCIIVDYLEKYGR
jgi:UDP-N-acetylglucosamine 2-epimerase (non-hydrolysing)